MSVAGFITREEVEGEAKGKEEYEESREDSERKVILFNDFYVLRAMFTKTSHECKFVSCKCFPHEALYRFADSIDYLVAHRLRSIV